MYVKTVALKRGIKKYIIICLQKRSILKSLSHQLQEFHLESSWYLRIHANIIFSTFKHTFILDLFRSLAKPQMLNCNV